MELSQISATKKNTGLCVGGWHKYNNPHKDTIPISYSLKILTPNPQVFLYVNLPITAEMELKFKELKKRCLSSTHHMVEITFENLEFETSFVKWTDKGFETLRYKARATNFYFVED